jgi:uncharacterized protein with GYD domain
MALTRKSLKAMGLTDEQVDSIVEMHTETVDGLKDRIAKAEEKVADYDKIKKDLDDMKGGKDYKSEYAKLESEFKAYKKDIADKETAAAKTKAVRAYFESKGIKGANLEIAMRGAKDEISAVELDGDKIKDEKPLESLVNGDFKALIVSTSTQGAASVNPPANGGTKRTKEEIMAIKDAGERQRAIAQNLELFGYSPNGKEY